MEAQESSDVMFVSFRKKEIIDFWFVQDSAL